MSTSRGTSPGATRNPAERYGTVKWRNYDGASEFWGFLVLSVVFCCLRPICGGFAYLVPPRLVLGVNVYPRGTSPGAPRKHTVRYGAVKSRNVCRGRTEPRGAPRNGKIAELRLESGISGIPGQCFCIHCVVSPSTVVSRI